MEPKTTFNEVAELYDRTRNHYPEQLFHDLARICGLTADSRVLEIGPGTGIATLPLAELGCSIVGVELGADLAAVARRKLAGWPQVNIEVAAFEDWQPPTEPFDLVFAATAFHWLKPGVRYRKSAALLRPGGYLAVAQYLHVAGGDQSFFERVQDCYERYMPGTPAGLQLQQPEQIVPETTELIQSGLFEPPIVHSYLSEETYSSERYLDLLSTYSTHRVLAPSNRQQLFNCVAGLINRDYHGSVRKRYYHELVIARKA